MKEPPPKRKRGRGKRTLFRCDPFHPHYVGIINGTHALLLALMELSLEPTSACKSIRLKVAARELRRRCNRLTYKLSRAKKP
jgi:hypothetical protein